MFATIYELKNQPKLIFLREVFIDPWKFMENMSEINSLIAHQKSYLTEVDIAGFEVKI